MCVCACFSVCCGLSLTPNSLSLIGCVILWKDKEGHWKGSLGRRETGQRGSLAHNCLACSFTGIQRDSHTLSAHRPCHPRYLTSSSSSSSHPPHTHTIHRKNSGWSCNGIKPFQKLKRVNQKQHLGRVTYPFRWFVNTRSSRHRSRWEGHVQLIRCQWGHQLTLPLYTTGQEWIKSIGVGFYQICCYVDGKI